MGSWTARVLRMIVVVLASLLKDHEGWQHRVVGRPLIPLNPMELSLEQGSPASPGAERMTARQEECGQSG